MNIGWAHRFKPGFSILRTMDFKWNESRAGTPVETDGADLLSSERRLIFLVYPSEEKADNS